MSERAGVEERRTRHWVNVVRIGLEFGREDCGEVGRGGGEDRGCASRLKAGSAP